MVTRLTLKAYAISLIVSPNLKSLIIIGMSFLVILELLLSNPDNEYLTPSMSLACIIFSLLVTHPKLIDRLSCFIPFL